ncbi:MAG TPA: hypothetical protein VMT62_02425 [Syntrophorhabdaceae bacterium]|nr:hypothetical protein [Syntrophorhabdaceae bacterium]
MRCGMARNQEGAISKLLLFAVVVGILCYGYYYFKGTPRYALIEFKKAVVFSSGETAEKFLDLDSVVSYLPDEITRMSDKEALKKRIIHEIDSPEEKVLFKPVTKWNVFTVPINIEGETAMVEQEDGTTITLQKTDERYWVITSIRFQKTSR